MHGVWRDIESPHHIQVPLEGESMNKSWFGIIWFLGGYLFVGVVAASDDKIVANAASDDSQGQAHDKLMTPGWYISADLYGMTNPLGALLATEFTYNIPYARKEDMVWSHVEFGYRVSATVVHSSYGVHLEWMPWAFFRLRANYDLRWYHGTMGSLLEMDSPNEPHQETDVYEAGTDKVAIGHRLWIKPTLQLYFEGVLLLNQTNLKWYLVDSERDYFFNWEYSNISESKDFLLASSTMLMYNFFKNRSPQILFVGGMYEVVSQPSTSFRSQTLGAVILLEPYKDVGRLGRPHFLVFGGAYLEETYRKNEPNIAFNVGTTFDFTE